MRTQLNVVDIDNKLYPIGTKLVVVNEEGIECPTEIVEFDGIGSATYAIVLPYGENNYTLLYNTAETSVYLAD